MEAQRITASNFDISKAANPIACVVHMIFKVLAGASYLFLGLFTSSSVHQFVAVLLLNSVDFWVVKNVTGRKLIGLRWWTFTDLDFENLAKENEGGELQDLDSDLLTVK